MPPDGHILIAHIEHWGSERLKREVSARGHESTREIIASCKL